MTLKTNIGSLEDYNMGLKHGRNKALDEVEKKIDELLGTFLELYQVNILKQQLNKLREK